MMQTAMKASILAIGLLTSLAASAPTPGSWSTDTISKCEAAPNCETYIVDGKTQIRFKAGMGVGTEDYRERFGTNSSTSGSSLTKRDDQIDTQVQFGDTSINFGSTPPDGTYGVYHHLYDICHQSTCDPSGIMVDSQFIVAQGSSTGPATWQLTLTADAEYDGYTQRNWFVDAIVAAAGQGVQRSTKNWCVHTSEGDDCGSLAQNQQTTFINVARYDNGDMQGFLQASVSLGGGDSGWCDAVSSIWANIAGAIVPVAGEFFGLVSAGCQ
jgi:hypothetical protein